MILRPLSTCRDRLRLERLAEPVPILNPLNESSQAMKIAADASLNPASRRHRIKTEASADSGLGGSVEGREISENTRSIALTKAGFVIRPTISCSPLETLSPVESAFGILSAALKTVASLRSSEFICNGFRGRFLCHTVRIIAFIRLASLHHRQLWHGSVHGV